MPDPTPAPVVCPSCGDSNVRVVGQKHQPPGFWQAPILTRNYQCAACFHRWDVTIPDVKDSRGS